VADILAFDDSEITPAVAVASHEVAEQSELQRSGDHRSADNYQAAHEGAGNNAENVVSGNIRIDAYSNASSFIQSGFRYSVRYATSTGIQTVHIKSSNGKITVRDNRPPQ